MQLFMMPFCRPAPAHTYIAQHEWHSTHKTVLNPLCQCIITNANLPQQGVGHHISSRPVSHPNWITKSNNYDGCITHIVKDAETSSAAVLLILLQQLLSPNMFALGRLQTHGDHLRAGEHDFYSTERISSVSGTVDAGHVLGGFVSGVQVRCNF